MHKFVIKSEEFLRTQMSMWPYFDEDGDMFRFAGNTVVVSDYDLYEKRGKFYFFYENYQWLVDWTIEVTEINNRVVEEREASKCL